MGDWHADDSFWESFTDFLFDARRIEMAREEAAGMIALLQLAPGASVLDLCCGVGRHSLEFARRGMAVTGVDRTRAYLAHARAAADNEGLRIEFIESDMRTFARANAFDAAINFFTGFGYFDDPADDRRVAANVFQSLRAGGRFLIDVNGKEVIAGKFRERDWQRGDDGAIYLEERRLLDDWSVIESHWTLIRGSERREAIVRVRLYSGVELRGLLRDAGFREVALFGSLAAAPYDQDAARLIAVATR